MNAAPKAAVYAAAHEGRMTENDLFGTIRDLLKVLGIGRWYHTRYSLGSNKGFPDLVICAPAAGLGVLYRELKSARGKPTPEQQAWLTDLQTAGEDACVWRPADLTQGRIHEQLIALRGL